jgi:hypothetical protein
LLDLFQNVHLQAVIEHSTQQQIQKQVKEIEAAGHVANNQVENGSITWIKAVAISITNANADD